MGRWGDDVRARRASPAFYPWVGLGLGAVAAVAGAAAAPHVGALVAAVLTVAILALATGGLHLDGVADVFDGLSGAGGDRDRALAIMRDPRIGAHGAVALVLFLAAKIVLVAALLDRHDVRAVALAPLVGRAAVVPLVVLFPVARPDGLARTLGSKGAVWTLALAWAFAALAVGWARPAALVAGGVALALAFALGAWLSRRLRGLTGDCYGLAVEAAEVAFLAALTWR